MIYILRYIGLLNECRKNSSVALYIMEKKHIFKRDNAMSIKNNRKSNNFSKLFLKINFFLASDQLVVEFVIHFFYLFIEI